MVQSVQIEAEAFRIITKIMHTVHYLESAVERWVSSEDRNSTEYCWEKQFDHSGRHFSIPKAVPSVRVSVAE